jgi:hypothetical protein
MDQQTAATKQRRMAVLRSASVACLAALLSLIAISSLASEAYRDAGQPALSLELNPYSAGAASDTAAKVLREGNSSGAILAALQALALAPLSPTALRVLSLSEKMPHQQKAFLRLASRITWRDADIQHSLLELDIQNSQYRAAAARADAIARTDGIDFVTSGILNSVAITNEGRSALVRRLVLRPNWREPYLKSATSLFPLVLHTMVLQDLYATHAPPSPSELSTVINQLISIGGYQLAYDLWDQSKSYQRANPYIQLLLPGSYQSPFEWSFNPESSVASEAEITSDGHILINFQSNGTINAVILSKLLLLKPGKHQFFVVSRRDSHFSARAFQWEISCLNSTGKKQVLSRPQQTSGGSVSVSFNVPSGEQCATQQVSLFSQQVDDNEDNEISYADVNIE